MIAVPKNVTEAVIYNSNWVRIVVFQTRLEL